MFVIGALLGAALGLAQAQSSVAPPPLPPASEKIRVEPGLSPPERMRHTRAHQHKVFQQRDPTRPDGAAAPALPGGAEPAPAGGINPFGAMPGSR